MISLRKALALIICLTLVCGCLASCEILDALGSGSQTKVDPDKYEATVRIVFASNDSKMKAALSAVSSTSTVRSSGSSLEVYTEGKGSDISVTDSYILTGGMLYHTLIAQSHGYSVIQRKAATFNETEEYLLLALLGPGAGIDKDDFNNVIDGSLGYTCENITDEAREGLEKTLADKLAVIGATVMVDEVTLLLNIENGLTTSSTLSSNLVITLDGEEYEVTMRTYTDYDYKADVPHMMAPSDASEYEVVSYEEIMK